MTRKIIQVATIADTKKENLRDVRTPAAIYALCDDGTLWCRAEAGGWLQISNVPQDDPPRGPDVPNASLSQP